MLQIKQFQHFFKILEPMQLFSLQTARNCKWTTRKLKQQVILNTFENILSCTSEMAMRIYDKMPSITSVDQIPAVKENIEFLISNNIPMAHIIDNPFLLIMKIAVIRNKLTLIKKMQPRTITDFLPLIELNQSQLNKIAILAEDELDQVPERHRIYYFSKELKIKPDLVARHFVKNEFIFAADFTGLQKKLRILLDYKVEPLNILQGLYVFACSDQLFIKRLERMQSKGITAIKLWMVKCTDEQFKESLRDQSLRKKATPPLDNEIPKVFLEKSEVLKHLYDILSCDDEEAAIIYYNNITYLDQLESAKENIIFLTKNNISKRAIIDHSFVLTMPLDEIQIKLSILYEMKPRNIEDFVPMLRIETKKLLKIRDIWKSETTSIPEQHRIYYFSKHLQIKPQVVCDHFSRQTYMFFGAFNNLISKLDIIIAHTNSSIGILSCLCVFQSSCENIENKCNRMKSAGIEKFSPWILSCGGDRLEKHLKSIEQERKALNDCTNVEEYLSKRLNWDQETLVKMKSAFPVMFKYSAIKVKNHVDFLLNDTYFTIDDINQHIFVLRRNLDELKCRLNELTSLDYVPELFEICYDKKRYLKVAEKACRNSTLANSLDKFQTIEKRIKLRKSIA